MFGPIVSNLDSILNSSDNPQITVESVLNVLKSKFQLAKDNQLKIDDIATENITQNNNNTYQKEVTKKGTHSSRNKQQNQQQQQQFKETRQNIVSKTKTKVTSCRSKNVKEDSTEQTERHNSRSELTDSNTICDKQSLRRNIDADIAAAVSVAAAAATFVSENNSMKQQKTTTNSGAFLSAIAAAAKKPTPASDTKNNEVGGIAAAAAAALPPTSNISKVKLDDVMPQPLRKSSVVIMTSESATDNMPVGLPRLDKFVSESHHKIIGDGKHRKEDAASQRNVRDGAANAIDRAEDNQEAWRKNLPAAAAVSSPVRNEPTKSGEMEKLMYRKNALYTFIKYLESGPTSQNKQDETENLNDNLENLHISNEDKTQEEDDEIQQEKEDNLENVNKFNPHLAKCNCGEKQLKEQLQNETDIKAILDERNAFIKRCKNDPFYNNPQFPQPWKVLSKISKVIAHEIVDNFENDLSFGEESYVRDFINMETQN
ncbi:uncharacterized protein LOC129911121 [Episyrphus balteatus]|uniref:uncharacterized protein LOC129911121 n=1 Tax=Episyrphus balteatus TaxID=286459 RepID=UPI0024867A13|nr:uncharacterized protein LOC129911121 [Episyrphus balteatus]